MAELDPTTFEGTYNNATTGSFKTTGLRAILAATMRQFTTDIKDSFEPNHKQSTSSTATGSITIDFANRRMVTFVGSASFATAKLIVTANDSIAQEFYLAVEITNVAATLDFGSGSIFQSNDLRFNVGTQILTFTATGTYIIHGVHVGANWWLDLVGSGGGIPAGWALTGTSVLTGDTVIDNDVHNLLIGDLAGPWSSHDIDGSGPTTVPNSQSSGAGNPSGTDYSFFFNRVDLADNNAFQIQSASAAGGFSQFNIGSTATGHGFASFQLGDGVNLSDFILDDTGFTFQTNTVSRIRISPTGSLGIERTVTAGGTTGARTINKMAGVVNFAAGASTLVVTNSLATTSSIILVQVLGVDTTPKFAVVTRAAGSFTITLNAVAVAELPVAFWLTN